MKRRQFWAILLSMIMVLSLFSFPVYAEGDDEEDSEVADVIALLTGIDSLEEMQYYRVTVTREVFRNASGNYSSGNYVNRTEQHIEAQNRYKTYVEDMFAKRAEAKAAYDSLTEEQKAAVAADETAAANLAKLEPYDELTTKFLTEDDLIVAPLGTPAKGQLDYPIQVTGPEDENDPYIYEFVRAYEISQSYCDAGLPANYALVDTTAVSGSFQPDGFYEYGSSNYEVTYCSDTRTAAHKGSDYKRVNLEDADYYSAEDASHIRTIVENSYPFVSVDEMKQLMIDKGFDPNMANALTRSDMIMAVQAAIWSFTNSYEDVEYIGTAALVEQRNNRDYLMIPTMHDYRNEDWTYYVIAPGDYYSGYLRYTYYADVETRINALTDFLRSLPGTYPSEDQIVITDVQIAKTELKSGAADTYQIDLNVFLNHGTASAGDDVTISAVITSEDGSSSVVSPETVSVDGKTVYQLSVEAKYGDTVRIVVDGTQILEKGVYFYEARGGYEDSQSLVGVAEGETRVHTEESFVFEAEADMGIRIFKTGTSTGLPISGITFNVYTVEPAEGESISETPTEAEIARYAVEANLAGSVTTDNTGYAFMELSRGTYLVVEQLNPDKIKEAADPFYVTLPGSVETAGTDGAAIIEVQDIVPLYIENTPLGSAEAEIKVTKSFNNWSKADSFAFVLEAVTDGAPMPKETTAAATEADPVAVFGKIAYDKAGTYLYTITEINDGIDGVAYDTAAHMVTVTVARDSDGDLAAQVDYEGASGLTVTNEYNPARAEIKVQKELTGRDWRNGDEFTFTLEPVGEAPMPENSIVTVVDGEIYGFGEITYEEAGTYSYTVVESAGTLTGVSYDTAVHDITVAVAADAVTNELIATVTYADSTSTEALVIINEYNPARAEINVQKNLTGRDWKTGDEFTFTLEPVDGAPMPTDSTVTVGDGGVYGFGEIVYEETGTYGYTVSEAGGTLDGVTYDTAVYTVTVIVTMDEGTNALTAEVTYADSTSTAAQVITNEFNPTEAEIRVQKNLTGRDWKTGDEFTFTLEPADEAPMPADSTVTVNDGEVSGFGKIMYEAAGIYEYTVTETHGTLDGVTYDTDEYEVTVTVTRDEETNELTAVVTYDNSTSSTVQVITNEYNPTAVEIKVQKNLTGRAWRDGDTFRFVLKSADGAPMPADNIVTAQDSRIYSFGEITYKAAGTYGYTITESIGTLEGMTYDTTEYEVTVTVTRDEETNELTAEVAYAKSASGDAQVITNEYAPAKAEIKVQKNLTGRDWQDGDEFTFTLMPVDGAPMPADSTVTVKDGEVYGFGAVIYETAGTYRYTIAETAGTLEGVTYDTAVYNVTVTVAADEKTNELTTEVTYADSTSTAAQVITNEYAPAKAEIKVQKNLTGRDWQDGDEFAFTLTPADGSPMPVDGTVTVKDGEVYGFGEIVYEATGTYSYTIAETDGTLDGVTYDTTIYNVTVMVATDEKTNELTAAVTYDNSTSTAAQVITNEYVPAKAEIKVQKELTGRDWETDDEFTFMLTPVDGAPMSADSIVTVKDGEVYGFGEIVYEEAGTYKYTIAEAAGTMDGVAYDTAEYKVTVTVTRNEETNELTAVVSYTNSNSTAAQVITNEYAPVKAEIKVQKNLTGRDWETGDEFTFTLASINGAPMPADSTVTVKDGGIYGFGEITFAKAGTYTYKVKETKGTLDGVIYDKNEYTVKVVVSKDEVNALTAELTYEDKDAEVQIFLNEFASENAEVKVRKELLGREWRDGDSFRFVLKAVDGAPMPEGAEEDGTAILTVTDGSEYSFGKIVYEKAGTYTYTLAEIDDGLPGITYDAEEHTVTVAVTRDEETNELTAFIAAGRPVTVFTNTYDSKGEVRFEAEKVLEGKNLEGGQFSFVLTDEDGKVLQIVTNGADGKIVFDSLAFTEKDFLQADGTYAETVSGTYTISEVIPDEGGKWLSYDETVYTVTVILTDIGNGTITSEKTVTKNGKAAEAVVFTNTYSEPEETEITVEKIWDDSSNKNKHRPASVTVHLFADGKEVKSFTITEADSWKKTVSGLRKYTDDGKEIVYTVTEDEVKGYSTQINGFRIVNTETPPSPPPKTGDHSHALLWGLVLGASTLALGALLVLSRRKKGKN